MKLNFKNLGQSFKRKERDPDAEPNPKRPTFKERWHYFWVGTDKHRVHPFSWKAKLYRWYLKKFRNYVDYITTMYDKPNDELIYDLNLVKKKDIPREAVKVTGMKKTYHNDLDLPIRGFDARRDRNFTASSAFNYMKSNIIHDAVVFDVESYKPEMDKNKVLLICAVVFGVFMAFYLFIMPTYM